jgi:type VI secretion system protein ImpH
MANPNWSKLPNLVDDLIAEAPRYALFQALAGVEKAWAHRGSMGDGLDRWVRIHPHPGLSFPPADLRRAYMDGEGVLHVEANVYGLYGVDAPMPHYLLETANSEEATGQRLRAFLDIFNHRLYTLLYEAWRLEDAVEGSERAAFRPIARALAGGAEDLRLAHAGGITRRQPSPTSLATTLIAEFDVPARVRDCIPQWMTLPERQPLGAREGPVLGNDAILGDGLVVASGRVDVEIGPVPLDDALRLLPGQEAGDRLLTLARRLLGPTTPFDVVVHIATHASQALSLGQDSIPLGWASWLGDELIESNAIRITAGRQ